MSATAPRITCLYFSDATVVQFLKAPAGQAFAADLLVECSSHPALSVVLNAEMPGNYPGIAGLLGGADLGSLAHASDRISAPIIFAAASAISPTAIRSALVLLARPDERVERITLLVPFAEARAIGSALTLADSHAIAWDVSAAPHEELVEFATWIEAEKILTTENFSGLFPYASQPVDSGHAQKLTAMLAPLAGHKIRTQIPLV
jgi:hypothetical protein